MFGLSVVRLGGYKNQLYSRSTIGIKQMIGPQGERLHHDDYLRHRDNLDKLRIEQSSSLDKTLLTLGSSALGFSMVLVAAFSKFQKPSIVGVLARLIHDASGFVFR